MHKLLFFLLLLGAFTNANAQNYNNEWIDYSKSYYKFKVGVTRLYRINQSALPADISTTPVQNFQLWRNGVQVPLFTSVASGVLPANGFIEFWGEKNDGVLDKKLYRNQNDQLNDRISLQTDTAAFFLTVNNSVANNLRYNNGINNVAGNTLLPQATFTYTHRFDFKEQIARGLGQNAGERVTSSSYDVGEGWGTRDIAPSTPYTISSNNLSPANTSTTATLKLAVSGVSYLSRNVTVKLNNSNIISSQLLDNQNSATFSSAVASSLITNSNNDFRIEITPTSSGDNTNRISVAYLSLTYERQFNFANSTNFSFSLAASANPSGTYLEITNFNSIAIPIIYDVTNNVRYVAVVSSGVLRFALPFSSISRNFILVSQDNSAIETVSNLTSKTFTNFSLVANQANYLIVSNKLLGLNTNQSVDLYRQYRASNLGGSFNAKVYDIDELTDQFAYGIKKHPLSVKNFVLFAKQIFSTNPTHLFLIGKGVAYDEYRYNESSVFAERLNLIPTFGWPASDVLLASDGINPLPLLMVGRLSAINGNEVNIYLQKVKEFEAQQANNVQTIANKLWMKHILHVAGSNDLSIKPLLINYLDQYEITIADTLYGGSTRRFYTQATPDEIERMKRNFESGASILTYFGHSAATQLDYNLNNPLDYSNQGKYPMFVLNGCNAGNFFDFDTSRLSNITSFAEKFVLANQRGAIGVVASTHFGLTGYLHSYTTTLYQSIGRAAGYKNFIGKNMIDALAPLSNNDFFARMHAEQFLLHGDPAVIVNAHDKPDYVVEDQTVTITPSVLSVADDKFTVKTVIYNLGKAQASRASGGGDSLQVTIKWQRGDGSVEYLYRKFLRPSVRYADSISIDVPISPLRDNGNNCITVILDSLNQYNELSESNNTINKCFFIFNDDVKPVFPYKYAIINKNNLKLTASTANPFAPTRQYIMELDTTELFNSFFKITKSLSSIGGVIEFDPQIIYTDSTVYYWRVAAVPQTGLIRWNTSNFMYINGTDEGYTQTHLYQHLKSTTDRIKIDSFSRRWNFGATAVNFSITQGVFPFTNQDADFSILKNGLGIINSGCLGYSVRWSLFDPVTLKPYYNQANPGVNLTGVIGGFMGSHVPIGCNKAGREFNFEFGYNTLADRNKMRDFIDWIPNGVIAIARVNLDDPFDTNPVAIWQADAVPNGSLNNTLYAKLIANGFTNLDQFNTPKPWVFMFRKNASTLFTPRWKFGFDVNDVAHLDALVTGTDTLGYITSPILGPAKAWKQLKWRGTTNQNITGDTATINIVGVTTNGTEVTLFNNLNLNQQDFNISSISATTYPYLILRMSNKDAVNLTPYQLRYWHLIADMVPEGAIAPNIRYAFKDSLELGEKLNVAVAFKNISTTTFTDSISVKMQVTNSGAVTNNIVTQKLKKPLIPGDTATIVASISTDNLAGKNTLFIDVNPNFEQAEQTRVNNFLYKNFFVNNDNINPIVDVTFDGTHILNGDIVSAKPAIRINLKDEAKFMLLNDTAGVNVQLRSPNGTIRKYNYGSDTLRFTPATSSGSLNNAIVDFTPSLMEDGEYELFVKGKDRSGNNSGTQDYRVTFNVLNKPMISEVFNYPNPFTSSTAFVFTLTGSKLPTNIRIQIMTVTGKIVKEINMNELGPLHIGRNVTDYKWDGTDMYGQKMGNGVYLFRVITNNNGDTLEKFDIKDSFGDKIKLDKYFKGGYGKMYLMR